MYDLLVRLCHGGRPEADPDTDFEIDGRRIDDLERYGLAEGHDQGVADRGVAGIFDVCNAGCIGVGRASAEPAVGHGGRHAVADTHGIELDTQAVTLARRGMLQVSHLAVEPDVEYGAFVRDIHPGGGNESRGGAGGGAREQQAGQ